QGQGARAGLGQSAAPGELAVEPEVRRRVCDLDRIDIGKRIVERGVQVDPPVGRGRRPGVLECPATEEWVTQLEIERGVAGRPDRTGHPPVGDRADAEDASVLDVEYAG